MAKQLDFVRLLIEGDATGPSTAKFVYKVYEDTDATLSKVVHQILEVPDFTDSVENFFDGYVATIKANEGIA